MLLFLGYYIRDKKSFRLPNTWALLLELFVYNIIPFLYRCLIFSIVKDLH